MSQGHDDVSVWGDMSTSELSLEERVKTIENQQSRYQNHLAIKESICVAMIRQKNVVSQYRTAHNKIIPLALYKSPQDTVAEVHVQGKENTNISHLRHCVKLNGPNDQ